MMGATVTRQWQPTRSRAISAWDAVFRDDFGQGQANGAAASGGNVPVCALTQLDDPGCTEWQAGFDLGFAEARAWGEQLVLRAQNAAIAQLANVREEMTALAETAAEALAQLLMDCVVAVFPEAGRNLGATEAAAISQALTQRLRYEPSITVHVSAHNFQTVGQQLGLQAQDLGVHVVVTPSQALASGDIRIAWRNGQADRQSAALAEAVADALRIAGLSGS
jgi:flagellar biosynthesis/type III secretory pathway protein FliH